MVAIPKPNKDPKNYKPISLLCDPFKTLERLIYACIKPVIDPVLPREEAGFQCKRLTINQVTLLTQETEDNFSAKKKAGIVFVDLTAAYNTVWHCGLTCKLLCLLAKRHMILLIMEIVHDRSFTFTTGARKQQVTMP